MTPLEVVCVFWPITIPAHAHFSITSPFSLKVIYPHNVSFTLTFKAPIHLSSPSPVRIVPSGVLSPGFARGWSSLPAELKLAILRYNVVYSSTIWPANANRVLRESLFPYLRMTPEIAIMSRGLFFAENTFIVLPLQEELTMFRGFPPVSVRPLIRRVMLLTWLELGDGQIIEAIAEKKFGFHGLARIEIRCSVVKLVRSFLSMPGISVDDKTDVWPTQLYNRLPQEVRFEPNGVITFDRMEFARGGVDGTLLKWVETVEVVVKERFKFGVHSIA